MISQDLAWPAAALPLAGFASYTRATLRGRAQPSRMSWPLWAAAPLIAFAAELAQHTSPRAALVTLTLGIGPLLVTAASLTTRQAHWKLTRADAACGALSAAALGLWLTTRHGDLAIALAILADAAAAAAPTVRKSWSHPRSESAGTYLASGTGAVITLLTLRHWTFAACGFPAYAATVCTLISALILLPRPASPPPPPGPPPRPVPASNPGHHPRRPTQTRKAAAGHAAGPAAPPRSPAHNHSSVENRWTASGARAATPTASATASRFAGRRQPPA